MTVLRQNRRESSLISAAPEQSPPESATASNCGASRARAILGPDLRRARSQTTPQTAKPGAKADGAALAHGRLPQQRNDG
eukprot:8702172-Pyramimonas_sp.AAC.1